VKTVLFATRMVAELEPLTDASCLALLSVACKPLIVHTVEALAMAELKEVIVIVSPHADAVEAVLGDGTPWGMRFEYVLATARESDERTIERIRHRLGDIYLLVRGEMLRTPIIAKFVERAQLAEARAVVATIGGVEAGMRLVRNGTQLRANDIASPTLCGEDEVRIEFTEARLSLLDSLREFHRASLDLVAGHFTGLVIPGREVAPGVKVGRHSNLPANAIKETPLLIGARCRIADNAELCGGVVVSNDVVIDNRAVIRSSVIMPNTYVGELVEVTNAIVAGNRLIHVDTGTVATVADSFLLASIRRTEIGGLIRDLADRAMGAILLAASLWLWPIALIAAMAVNPRAPIRSKLLVGNRERDSKKVEFKVFEFAIAVPMLRYLPYLLAVVSGRLRLVGVEPLEAGRGAGRIEEWELVRDEGHVGLFGPVQLTASHDTPDEQRRIMEAYYVGTRSLGEDLRWMLRAVVSLASRRAWCSTKPSVTAVTSDRRSNVGITTAAFAKDSSRRIDLASFEGMTLVPEGRQRSVRPSVAHRR